MADFNGDQVDCTRDHVKKVSNNHAQQSIHDKQPSGSSLASHLKEKSPSREMSDFSGDQVDCTRDHVKKVNNNNAQQSTHDKQQSGSSLASHLKAKSPGRKMADFNGDTTGGEEDQVPADHTRDDGKLPSENREATAHVNQRCTKRSIQIEDIVFNKRPRKESKYTYPAIPQLRRTRLPFTVEEEEMIKVGVSRFATGNEGKIPWTIILEFGANVFLKGCTTNDLKDKWRNMCKCPKSK